MKRLHILTFCAALILLLCCILPTKAEAATSGYYTYTVSNGKATITDCSTSVSGSITIPSTLGGYPVTKIGNSAFNYCDGLTSITIPDSVTSIGNNAFEDCSSLTSITIPDSVTSIGDCVFYNCTGLKSITIPDSVTRMGSQVFYCCSSLKSITIPDCVTRIDGFDFQGCSSLTSITIPDSVTSIGEFAFNVCRSLTSITIPDGVTSIGDYAFNDCSSLTHVAYTGTQSQWSKISIGSNNDYLTGATRHYETVFQEVDNCVEISTYCPVCQITLTRTAKPNGSHAFTAATCTTPKTCTVCGAVEGEPLSHSFGNWVQTKAPTCTEAGREARSCICGKTETRQVVAIGHSYEANVTAPTCTETGYTTNTCSACGDVKITNYLTAMGHSGELWFDIIAPTCTAEGMRARICSVCSETETQPVAALGHSYSAVVTAPTCTELGYTTNTCSVCGDTTVADYVDATGHSLDSVVTAPTCTEQGYTTNTCSVCGDVTVTDYVAAAGHSYSSVVVEPTCTEQGYTTKTCATCGDVTTEYVPAKGHGWSAWITTVKPTCTTEGARMRFCNCGTRETEVIAKLPHSCENYICTVCGELDYANTVLTGDVQVNWNLTQDLHINLAGFDLSGTIITNGYKVYGMDSTTDSYTCDSIGYFTCVDEDGSFIVPERIYTEGEKQYMAICTEDRYSFHRLFVGTTHMSLEPEAVGLGYKAAVFGDEMVFAELAETKAFSFKLQLEGYNPVYRRFNRNELTSGAPIALRIRNYDVENYSEHNLYAQVSLTLSDGTVIEAEQVSLTFRWLTEQVNENYTDYTADQLASFKAMLQQFDIVKKWNIPNLI